MVCGLLHEDTQRQLFTERYLTLARAFEIAIAMETAAKGALELQKKTTSECTVNKIETMLPLWKDIAWA